MSDKNEEIRILMLDRGHVLVGRVSLHPDLAFHWRVTSARTIRQWGTTRGLAQLVSGPTKDTVLDDPANETIGFRAVLRILDASADGWEKYL